MRCVQQNSSDVREDVCSEQENKHKHTLVFFFKFPRYLDKMDEPVSSNGETNQFLQQTGTEEHTSVGVSPGLAA